MKKTMLKFFDRLVKDNGVNDFDVIGFSYYPFWHGSLTALQQNLDDMANRYGKEVVVAETAYGFTTDNYDMEKNHYGKAEERRSNFAATVQGQASGLRGVMNDLAQVPNGRGLGMFYWEPDSRSLPRRATIPSRAVSLLSISRWNVMWRLNRRQTC
ncbi:MAG: arabinogalactan endo-1,4-beta-galactosidase [Selenomonas sp.]|uniref:glycosyl hydrolase 53 family protein n=1 Tax=Selenomonas sp. TaxID=2053611 RepID=UPI0025FA96DC|nr:glycosyl hydrolase 53 family protein [Selenomonas sp.]MCR5438389.1 arabinogalactan endo-1,4-beta-galactosidase [Selenomonas sp.]